MPSAQPTPPPRPITARAAENGLYLSIYICVLVIATGMATSFAPASFIVWAGSLVMPFFLYRLLKKSMLSANGTLGFPELWAEGIASFFLGTLLPAVLAYILLRFYAPTFIDDTFNNAVELFRNLNTDEGELWAETLEDIKSKANLPTPSDVAAQIISFNIIVGTVLSLIVALWLKVRVSARGNDNRTFNN